MRRFLGRQTKRIDAKGRVSIPASFRAVLGADGFEGVFCVRSTTHAAIDAGGEALIAAIDQRLALHPAFSIEHTALATVLLGQGDLVALDGEGRMVVPEWMRAATGIAQEVLFVGLGDRFQIWAPDRFAAFETEARAVAARLLGVSPAEEA